MKTTVFFLIRHGEAEHNVMAIVSSFPETRERHLTDRGREQIALLADLLKKNGESIKAIFHSPLARTRETAEILGEALGVSLREDSRLRETDFGIYNERSIREFHERYPQKTARLETDGSDGVESFSLERGRVAQFCRDALSEFQGNVVAVVSHADTIQVLYGVLKRLSLDETFSFDRGICPRTGEMIRVEVNAEMESQ